MPHRIAQQLGQRRAEARLDAQLQLTIGALGRLVERLLRKVVNKPTLRHPATVAQIAQFALQFHRPWRRPRHDKLLSRIKTRIAQRTPVQVDDERFDSRDVRLCRQGAGHLGLGELCAQVSHQRHQLVVAVAPL